MEGGEATDDLMTTVPPTQGREVKMKAIPRGPIVALVLIGPPALGCPYCESEVGKEVAAGIFNDDFAVNLVLVLLPIPILFLIVYFIHYGLPIRTVARLRKLHNHLTPTRRGVPVPGSASASRG